MTYPPPPGGWQDPAGGQPTYIDPVSGQPAAVSPAPAQPSPPAAPSAYPNYPGYPADPNQYQQPGQPGQPGQPTQPGYPADPNQYAQPGQPTGQPGYPDPNQYAQQYQQAGQPGYAGYGAYPGYTPGMPVAQRNNPLAIASLCVSLAGVLFLACYGGGGVLGLVGAILGHVAKRQIAQRNEGGAGLAKAGTIVGWIVLGLGIIVLVLMIILIVWAANQPSYS